MHLFYDKIEKIIFHIFHFFLLYVLIFKKFFFKIKMNFDEQLPEFFEATAPVLEGNSEGQDYEAGYFFLFFYFYFLYIFF